MILLSYRQGARQLSLFEFVAAVSGWLKQAIC